MNIPGLGPVSEPGEYGDRSSGPIRVPVLGGQVCRIVVARYDDDANKEDFHRAIQNFLALQPSVLQAAAPHIFRYYQDCATQWMAEEEDFPRIERADEIWAHIKLGKEPVVDRRPRGDKGVYISLSCWCAWEREHGLNIVFKNGLVVTKVGEYDGHLTNMDAFSKEGLEGVIYRELGVLPPLPNAQGSQ